MSKRKPRQKSMRRGHLKRFSQAMVNTGQGPNTEVLGEYNRRNRGLREEYPTPISLNLESYQFTNKEGKREDLKDNDLFPGYRIPERIKTARKLRDLVLSEQANVWTKIVTWNRVQLSNGLRYCDTLFFSGNDCHIVRANKRTNEVSVSRVYHGLEHAKRVYLADLVQYKSTIIQDLFIQLSG